MNVALSFLPVVGLHTALALLSRVFGEWGWVFRCHCCGRTIPAPGPGIHPTPDGWWDYGTVSVCSPECRWRYREGERAGFKDPQVEVLSTTTIEVWPWIP